MSGSPGATNLARRFDEVAQTRPDEVALVCSGGACTYGELRRRVNSLAHALRIRGVERDVPVGIGMPRSIASIVAVLGILRAGGAYVPIDPEYPSERQRAMATDAGLRALVVDSRIVAAPGWAASETIVDLHALETDVEPPSFALPDGAADDLLNILYTSGSTGRPKGVRGSHGAMLNRLAWGWETFPFAAGEVVGHRSSLNFVDAGPEIFAGLLQGIPTAILVPEELADLGRFIAALRALGVTRLTVVPSIHAAMLRIDATLGTTLSELRTWITSGEELSLTLLRGFRAALPTATLLNLYGTTEVTGDATCAVFHPDAPLPVDAAPIGVSIAGAELIIVDAHGHLVPDGEPGELCIAGPVLALGYHHRPQEEAVRFPRHPNRSSARAFRTGDLVRRAPDGALLFLGRVDNLVKVRGVRVEPEEIERCLRGASPSIASIAVVLADDGQLVAVVTPADVDVEALRAIAARLLPAVMNPTRYVPMATLPLLPNGKFNRRALAAQVRATPRDLAADRLPQTATERRVAALWSVMLRRDDIARDDSFASLGGDSLALAELIVALEKTAEHSRIDLGVARDATLAEVARALDGVAVNEVTAARDPAISLTPLGEAGGRDAAVVAMLVEASQDAEIAAATELPSQMDTERARAYCVASEGVVIRVNGEPVGIGRMQRNPIIGDGVAVPAGAVQLDEWLLPRWRGQGLLSERGAWPLLAAWMAERFDLEVSVVWEDHLAMLAILRARGYTRLGRSYWISPPDGDGTSGFCEVWLYDLRPHRR